MYILDYAIVYLVKDYNTMYFYIILDINCININNITPGFANRGVRGVVPPTPPRDGPKNQLTFLFKAFFQFFFANHILHAVKCIKIFFSTLVVFGYPARSPLFTPSLYPP